MILVEASSSSAQSDHGWVDIGHVKCEAMVNGTVFMPETAYECFEKETFVVYPKAPTMATFTVSAEKSQGAQTLLTLATQPYRHVRHSSTLLKSSSVRTCSRWSGHITGMALLMMQPDRLRVQVQSLFPRKVEYTEAIQYMTLILV